MTGQHHWLAVASAEHVRRGRAEGFMQVCHGKRGPLARMKTGDGIVYYSPTEVFREAAPCRAFTAIGQVMSGDPYPHDMGNGFIPFRRDVRWVAATEAPIRPLLAELDFTRGRSNWGYPLRFGLIEISRRDFGLIGEAMGIAKGELINASQYFSSPLPFTPSSSASSLAPSGA